MYGENAAFCAVSEETDTALGIVYGGFFVGDTGALREKSDIVSFFQNVDGGFDGFQIACTAINGDRTEGKENLCEELVFEELLFCEEVDLALQLGADEENIVHADVIGADQTSTLIQLVFQAFDFQAEEKLIDGSEYGSEKTVHFCHGEVSFLIWLFSLL
jgi:hypothetical protein